MKKGQINKISPVHLHIEMVLPPEQNYMWLRPFLTCKNYHYQDMSQVIQEWTKESLWKFANADHITSNFLKAAFHNFT